MCLVTRWIMCLFFTHVIVVHGGGYLFLRFKSYENPNHRLYDGSCCEGLTCWENCDNRFDICISHPASANCEIGSTKTKLLGEDRITFKKELYPGMANPIQYKFGKWKGSATLSIAVWDMDEGIFGRDDLVDKYEKRLVAAAAISSSHIRIAPVIIQGRVSTVMFDYWVFCEKDYLIPSCEKYCVDTDDSSGHYTCDYQRGSMLCLSGWYGTNCDKRTDKCFSRDDDTGHIKCNPTTGDPECLEGWKDLTRNCTVAVNECQSNPCINNGTCKDKVNGYQCTCSSFYTGVHCETRQPHCLSSPCINGGNCTDLIGGYRCQCPEGYKGSRCQTDIDECSKNPCKNGTTCTNFVGSYKCICREGYSGKFCKYSIVRPKVSSAGPPTTSRLITSTSIKAQLFSYSSKLEQFSSSPTLKSTLISIRTSSLEPALNSRFSVERKESSLIFASSLLAKTTVLSPLLMSSNNELRKSRKLNGSLSTLARGPVVSTSVKAFTKVFYAYLPFQTCRDEATMQETKKMQKIKAEMQNGIMTNCITESDSKTFQTKAFVTIRDNWTWCSYNKCFLNLAIIVVTPEANLVALGCIQKAINNTIEDLHNLLGGELVGISIGYSLASKKCKEAMTKSFFANKSRAIFPEKKNPSATSPKKLVTGLSVLFTTFLLIVLVAMILILRLKRTRRSKITPSDEMILKSSDDNFKVTAADREIDKRGTDAFHQG